METELKLTVNMAKEIAMTTKNKNGKLIRDYYLLILKAYNNNKTKLGFTKDFTVCNMTRNEVEKSIFNNRLIRQELIEIELILKSCMEVED